MARKPTKKAAKKPTKAEIEYERDLLARVVQSSLNGILALKAVRGEDGGIVDLEWLIINQMACRMLGREQNSLLGKRLLEVMPGDKDSGMFARYVKVVETGRPMEHEHRFAGPNGEGWFRITAVKLDEGLVVTFSDISAYKNR